MVLGGGWGGAVGNSNELKILKRVTKYESQDSMMSVLISSCTTVSWLFCSLVIRSLAVESKSMGMLQINGGSHVMN
jgi:hypothetical protein